MTREIRVDGDVAYIPLSQGYEAIIDADDLPLVEEWDWSAVVVKRKDGSIRTIYAKRMSARCDDGPRRNICMHRAITVCPDGMECDHRDGNGLDNRRGNLRVATKAQNQRNARTRIDNKSGAKGVSWNKQKQKWVSQISIDGIGSYLGAYACVTAAQVAYAAASARLHGEYGRVA